MKKENENKFSFTKKVFNSGAVSVFVNKENRTVVVKGGYLGKELIGITKCSTEDTFNTKTGMYIALYRFLKKAKGLFLEKEKRKMNKAISAFDQMISSASQKANYVPRGKV